MRMLTEAEVHHIQSAGMVPIVAADPCEEFYAQPLEPGEVPGVRAMRARARVATFKQHRLLVQISAPFYEASAEYAIILLLDDLRQFCRVWYYSALSHPHLNQQLAASFALRDPYYSADPKPVTQALQRRLLLPFGDIKQLYDASFEGFDDAVRLEVKALMAVPPPSVQQCCEDAATLLDEGDARAAEHNFDAALNAYTRAFYAIHIIVDGRSRSIHADEFFHQAIEAGRFAGQTGTTVRVLLRIRLVSRTVLTLLRLRQPREAAFWGMRTIRIMREAIDAEFDEFLSNLVASADIGLVYARTAMAFALLEGDRDEELEAYACEGEFGRSAFLWQCAGRYLKGTDKEAERKRARDDAKDVGVDVPEGLLGLETASEKSDVDSMKHLDLGVAEAGTAA